MHANRNEPKRTDLTLFFVRCFSQYSFLIALLSGVISLSKRLSFLCISLSLSLFLSLDILFQRLHFVLMRLSPDISCSWQHMFLTFLNHDISFFVLIPKTHPDEVKSTTVSKHRLANYNGIASNTAASKNMAHPFHCDLHD